MWLVRMGLLIMILMMGKGVCRLRGRKWLDCGMVWHGRFLSEALWRDTFTGDDELCISILEERKKTRSIKTRRKSLLTLPPWQRQLFILTAERKKAPIKVHHQICCTLVDSAPEKMGQIIALLRVLISLIQTN